MKSNNYIKTIKAFSIAAGILFLSVGCDDFLAEKEVPRIGNEFYKTKQGVLSAVDATYSYMRYGVGGEFTNLFTELGTDLIVGAVGGISKPTDSYNSGLNPAWENLHNWWENNYKAINITNEVLQALPEIEGMSESEKRQCTSEMRFFRGYYYFDLVQQFGSIPLVTVADPVSVRTDFKRAPVSNIYNQIISDLRYAEENLNETATEKKGKATKYAAAHLLAKVYLTRGSAVAEQRGQQTTDMDSTLYYARKVIGNTKYALLDNFSDLWDIDNMGNKEVIFSVQFTYDLIYNGGGNYGHLYWCSSYESVPGMVRDIANGRPWGFHRPTNKVMFELFDRKNDSRFYKSFRWVNYANKAEKGLAIGDTAIYYSLNAPKPGSTHKYTYFQWNKEDETKNNDRYPSLIKHFDPKRATVAEQRGSREWVRMRLGETYLIAAEAAGRKGDYTTAITYINKLRERAAWKADEAKYPQYWIEEGGEEGDTNSTFPLIKVTENDIKTNFVDFMLDERGRELLGEYYRWEDLVRCEKLVEYVTKWNATAARNIKDYHRVRPIPQKHIDRLNPRGPIEEEQNKGYF
ncbi:RagB/SusD family nutrient uptake outer membrane protein [Dysgonomonas termitidis]|uniref:RagB/SusD family nutrient uptake outer membrane protein n=1 Tax=Dysgonomonas termitidis TaxID=1516126 RepID=A0ABV9L166_9BACT